jgi:pimeloyl-ACP methyl ester carboxylesterase
MLSGRWENPMTTTAQAVLTHVTSPDGIEIAVYISGNGWPLVAVHGTSSDHTTWRMVQPLLEPRLAVHAVDRRGRGGSGDSPAYSLAKERADIAAVVDATAAAAGTPVDLLGHSYGGNIAFGATALTPNVRKLVLYEGWPVPNIAHRFTSPDMMRHLESLLAQGRSEQLLETFYRNAVMMSDAEIASLKAGPTWPARVATAATIPREMRAFGAETFEAEAAARIAVPVLLLVGANSPAEVKADPQVVAVALPDARVRMLDGQTHIAHLTDPQSFAAELLSFLQD